MDTGTSVKPEETAAAEEEEIIILVDHGGIRVMRARFGAGVEPNRIRTLARAYRGEITYAALYTDRSNLPVEPRLQETKFQEWRNAGFKPIWCPRQPQNEELQKQHKSKKGSGHIGKLPAFNKETIDFHVIEGAHELARMNRGKKTPVRFVLVIGDGDYVPLSRTLHEQGFLVSVFLTSKCAFLDPTKTPHVDDRLILYEQLENDPQYKLGSTIDRAFGVRRDHYRLDGRQQKDALDRLSLARVTCPDCGEETPLGLWLTHPCHPERKHLMVNPNPEAGVVQPGFPTEDIMTKTVEWANGLGPKRFLQWYMAQMQVGTGPWFMEALLKQMRTIPWDVIDLCRLVSQIGREETMTVDEAISLFSEDVLKIASELKILEVTEEEEIAVAKGLYEHFEPLLGETRDRLVFRHISRIASEPEEGALTESEICSRVFDTPMDTSLAEHVEDIPQKSVDEIMHALDSVTRSVLIYWLMDRTRVDRTADEHKAVARIVKQAPESAIPKWISVLGFIKSELSHYYSGLEIADLIAKWAGDEMTLGTMNILLENGVLRYFPDKGKYSQGNPSHPVFTFLNQKSDAA